MLGQYPPSEHLSPKTYTWWASRGSKDLIPEREEFKRRQVILAFLQLPLDTRTKGRGRKEGGRQQGQTFPSLKLCLLLYSLLRLSGVIGWVSNITTWLHGHSSNSQLWTQGNSQCTILHGTHIFPNCSDMVCSSMLSKIVCKRHFLPKIQLLLIWKY